MRALKREHLALALILVVACALRFWRLETASTLGFDKTFNPDTPYKLKLIGRLAHGQFNVGPVEHPHFLLYTSGAVLAASEWLYGALSAPAQARVVVGWMMLLSSATAWLTYLLAIQIGLERRSALLSAALYAACPLAVLGSWNVKEDVPVTFLLVASLLTSLQLLRARTVGHACLAGFTYGAALGTKFCSPIFAPFFAYAVLAGRPRRAVASSVAVAALSLAAGFLLFNWQMFSSPRLLLEGLLHQARYAVSGHLDHTRFSGSDFLWTFYFSKALLPGLTAPVVLLGVIGLMHALAMRRAEAFITALFAFIFYAVFECSPSKPYPGMARYMLPVAPLICIFSAYALEKWSKSGGLAEVARLAGPLCICFVAARTSYILYMVPREPRTEALAWAEEHLDSTRTVLMDSAYSPQLSRLPLRLAVREFAYLDLRLSKQRIDYLVLSSFTYNRFLEERSGRSVVAALQARFRSWLSCPVVARFEPRFSWQTLHFLNPTITVHEVADCAAFNDGLKPNATKF